MTISLQKKSVMNLVVLVLDLLGSFMSQKGFIGGHFLLLVIFIGCISSFIISWIRSHVTYVVFLNEGEFFPGLITQILTKTS